MKMTMPIRAILVAILAMMATFALPATTAVAQTAVPLPERMAQLAQAVRLYAREQLQTGEIECRMDSDHIVIAFDVGADDGLRIFQKLTLLSTTAGAAAPWTRQVRIEMRRRTELLAVVVVPTQSVRRYLADQIGRREYFRSWKSIDLAAAPARPPVPAAGQRTARRRMTKAAGGGATLRARARERYRYDLDGDGRMEEILVLPFAKREEGDYYALLVLDENGTVIWRGPQEVETANPLVFGEWDFGISLPELIGDIDGDGAVELVVPAPQSDVSPVMFRVLRWRNRAFRPVRSAILLEQPPASGRFPWSHSEQYLGRWVSQFLSMTAPGRPLVETTAYEGGAGGALRRAILRAVPGGYVVERWLAVKPDRSDAATGKAEQDGTRPVAETSCADLWMARNRIFAAAGYCFKSARARAAFPGSCLPPYGKLSAQQSQQVKAIRTREHQLGCR